jgi:hypothetical protein
VSCLCGLTCLVLRYSKLSAISIERSCVSLLCSKLLVCFYFRSASITAIFQTHVHSLVIFFATSEIWVDPVSYCQHVCRSCRGRRDGIICGLYELFYVLMYASCASVGCNWSPSLQSLQKYISVTCGDCVRVVGSHGCVCAACN